jgi:PAS domain S-box-containing protein
MKADPKKNEFEQAFRHAEELRREAESGEERLKEIAPEALQALQISLEELRVAEEELRQRNEELASLNLEVESERQHYLNLFEFAPDGYLATDSAGVIREANRAAGTLFGVRQSYLIGKPLAVFVSEDERRQFRRELNRVQAEGVTRLTNWEVSCLNRERGSTFPALLTVARADDRAGDFSELLWQVTDITERKQMEDKLQESEQKLTILFELLPVGISVLDADNKITYMNPALSRILDISQEGLFRGDYRKRTYLRPDGTPMPADEFASSRVIREQRLVHNVEVGVVKEDSQVIWTNVSAVPVTLADWKMIIVTIDITERKQAEEALRRERDFAESLVETAQAIVLVLDAQGRIVRFNPFMEEISGYALAEVQGKDWFEAFVPEGERDRIRNLFLEAISCIQTRGNVNPIVTKDGRELEIEWYDKTLKDKRGNVAGLLAVGQDISERRQSEEALRVSEEKHRLLLENAGVGIGYYSLDGRVVNFNKTAAGHIGGSMEAFIGKSILEIFGEAQGGIYLQRIIDASESVGSHEYDDFVSLPGGDKYFHSIYTPVVDATERVAGVQIISHDVTEQVEMQKELEKLLMQSDYNQQMLLALNQAGQTVHQAQNLEEVYFNVGDELGNLGYQSLILTLCEARTCLRVGYLNFPALAREKAQKLIGLEPKDFRVPLEEGGLLKAILEQGVATLLAPITPALNEALPDALRPLVGELAGALGIERAISAPLIVLGAPYGLLVVIGRNLSEADIPSMSAFANQTSIAIENLRLLEAERTARQQLRDLANYLQVNREEERATIAREIHDEFGQMLTALKIDLAWLGKRLPPELADLAAKVAGMRDLVETGMQSVRRVVSELRPGLLDDLGLSAALEWQAQDFARRTGIECQIDLGEEDIWLDNERDTAIFRIFQETLTNIARHAEASLVSVVLREEEDCVRLVVQDNGKGIAPEAIGDPRSLGLMGMRERALSLRGRLEIIGAEGEGTWVMVSIPKGEAR